MCLAVPGRVLDIAGDDPLTRTGRVDFGGVIKEISLAYTPEAVVGDHVLVHVGFAIAVLREGEAARLLAELEALGEHGRAEGEP